jgi:hypothetical protein
LGRGVLIRGRLKPGTVGRRASDSPLPDQDSPVFLASKQPA